MIGTSFYQKYTNAQFILKDMSGFINKYGVGQGEEEI